ncbi:MAG TPA: exodeoxyribonuclease V subunit gamma [Thermoanaerobaculia bacterium]|jgi:exodeoxyribonuclease V gamma subunit|nr:exodeoxyribonuclease V subunit gamma [Thermoanaerobaculia bacterium]
MIRLVYSNRTEELLAALAETLQSRRRAGAHPLEPTHLLVPNRNLEQHVRLALAERLGVAANLRFRRLERFVAELVHEASPGNRLVDAEALRGGLLALLHDEAALADPALVPVREYLRAADADAVALRRVQLATRLGRLFEEYAYSRPEMLAAWEAGARIPDDSPWAPLEAWQSVLWRAVAGRDGVLARHPPRDPVHGAGRWVSLADVVSGSLPLPTGQPPLHVFGVSYVARIFQQLFARLAETRPVVLFTLNPCQEFWEDVETEREHRRRLARYRGPLPAPEDDPYGLFSDTDNQPLRLWGRPGREHVRMLDDLTECAFEERFAAADATDTSLLAAVQSDVLRRAATGERSSRAEWARDGSVSLLAAPDLRREVEAVADAIWELVAASEGTADPLRFSEVAVIVNAGARDRYLPQVQAVFGEFHGIPCNVADLPFAGERRVAEAARLLLALPFGRFTRAEVLRVMLHPAVRGRFPVDADVDPDEWARLAAELGIFHGASREDLADTYVEEDLLSWDQGLRRLALGAFMTGGRAGDDRLWEGPPAGAPEGGTQQVLVADVAAVRVESAARFALLARSLLADCRRLQEESRPLAEWAELLRTLLDGYLTPGEGEEADLHRCRLALAALDHADVAGIAVPGRVACELASAAIAERTVGRGALLGEGVSVSTLLPMRVIPFRVVFVLGLGEGEFPAANRRDALDLRAAGRRAGDVSPAERDRYLFLETLLSARDKLVLSYVDRDERTGERLRPSSVVQELLDVLERAYVGKQGVEALRREVPPRRWDRAYFPAPVAGETPIQVGIGATHAVAGATVGATAPPTVAPGARAEAAARSLGDELRAALPAATRDPLTVLRHDLPPADWRTVARFLELPELSATSATTAVSVESVASWAPAAAAPAQRTLALRMLRRFLECPLQSSAEVLLGVQRDDDEDPATVEDESLASGRRDETTLLGDSLARALREGSDAREVYARIARRRELAGAAPTGPLGEIERQLHRELLAGWQKLLGPLADRGRGERLRAGSAGEREDVDVILPALELAAPAVVLQGRSELLLDGRRASVITDAGGPSEDNDEAMVRELRLALRGFWDHLLLAASGAQAAMKRQVVLLRLDARGPSIVSYALHPWRRDEALRYLAGLAEELLGGVHDYLLPCEAVFHTYAKSQQRTLLEPARVEADAVRRATTPTVACSSRWGPVPDIASYAVSPADELTAMLTRRFTPFLTTLGTRRSGSVAELP